MWACIAKAACTPKYIFSSRLMRQGAKEKLVALPKPLSQ